MKDSKGKWTKGPWTSEVVQEEGRFYHAVMILGKNEYGEEVVIARTPTVAVNEEANAALIAAAPEMYQMLRLVRMRFASDLKPEQIKEIDDLLEKAEGV